MEFLTGHGFAKVLLLKLKITSKLDGNTFMGCKCIELEIYRIKVQGNKLCIITLILWFIGNATCTELIIILSSEDYSRKLIYDNLIHGSRQVKGII